MLLFLVVSFKFIQQNIFAFFFLIFNFKNKILEHMIANDMALIAKSRYFIIE